MMLTKKKKGWNSNQKYKKASYRK